MGKFIERDDLKSDIFRKWETSGLLDGLQNNEEQLSLAILLENGATFIVSGENKMQQVKEKYGYYFECDSFERAETCFFPAVRKIFSELCKLYPAVDVCKNINVDVLIDIYYEIIRMIESMMTPAKTTFKHLDWEAEMLILFCKNYSEKLKLSLKNNV
jgi:hypothetical protein